MTGDSGINRDQSNTWYSFQKGELELLLAALGISSWYGIGDTYAAQEIKQADVNRLLADMFGRGIVSFDDGRLIISEEQKEIAGVIGNARTCIVSVSAVDGGMTCASYCCEDKAAVLRADVAGRVIVRLLDIKDWPSFILCEGLKESGHTENTVSGNGLEKSLPESTLGESLKSAVNDTGASLGLDLVNSRTGEVRERMLVFEHGLKRHAVIEQKDTGMSMLGGKLTELRRILRDWTTERNA